VGGRRDKSGKRGTSGLHFSGDGHALKAENLQRQDKDFFRTSIRDVKNIDFCPTGYIILPSLPLSSAALHHLLTSEDCCDV